MGDSRYCRRFGFCCAECYGLRLPDGRFAVGMMALELTPGALEGRGGRVFDSEAYAVEDEAALEALHWTSPPKEKGHSPSQDMFNLLVSMIYE